MSHEGQGGSDPNELKIKYDLDITDANILTRCHAGWDELDP